MFYYSSLISFLKRERYMRMNDKKGSKTKSRKRFYLIWSIIFLFAIAYAAKTGYTQDYPHNESTAGKCSDCHTSESPDLANSALVADPCGKCHATSNLGATIEKTHSSLNTSAKYGTCRSTASPVTTLMSSNR